MTSQTPNLGSHDRAEPSRENAPDGDVKYVLVMKEDITGFVLLEPASAANASNAAAGLQRWCTTLGALLGSTVGSGE